jgi:DNA invertase Pin-like site-specific DNA recombinase
MATGKRIGYIRVSTVDQNPERQLEGIILDKKFVEYASGSTLKRPVLMSMLDYIRDGDELFVHSVDRLARNARDLCDLVACLVEKQVIVHFVRQNLTFNGNDSPMAKFQLSVIGAVAELEREISLERQKEGIAIAKKAGKYKGSKPKLDAAKIALLKERMLTRDSKSQIAEEFGISRFTLYKYLAKIEGSKNDH